MSSQVPWKELAVVGATTLGVCCMIGWLTGAENLQKKKKPQQRGGAPNGSTVESQECDALISYADTAMKKGSYADVEMAYLKALEISSSSDDPRIQVYPLYIHRRLVELYEKMGKFDKCVKHIEVCIDFFAKKEDLTQEELQSLVMMVEQGVDLCQAAQAPKSIQEKFLLIWLDAATKLQNVQYAVMAALLLGKLKYSQDKLTEAEAFLRKAVAAYTDPSTREELWLSAKTTQLDCLTRLDQHEGAKQCVKEMADFLVNTDNFEKKKTLESLGDRCVFLGYYDEAEEILKTTHALLKRRGTSPAELAQVDHNLAVVWSATGRIALAREKIKEMKEYLRTSMPGSIFPSYSKYLHTQGVKHDDEGTTITLYRPKKAGLLNTGSVLVFRFEDPEDEDKSKEVEYTVQENDEVIKILGPFNYSNYIGQIFSCEISIFTGADKTIPIGTHFVFISSSDKEAARPPVSIENILASDTLRAEVQKQNPQAVAIEALLRSMQEGGMTLGDMDNMMEEMGEMGEMGMMGDMGQMGMMGELDGDDDEDDEDEEFEDDIGEGEVGDEDEEEEEEEEELILHK
eukprot:Phypoly_transcript_06099.p1 GENE.Phypoly_transcript_06099~~Phypoly_transcript_06099.p1  ORF type:complete len:572 (+),score=133.63 Phypoly_transcript_06099:117-1832(+)